MGFEIDYLPVGNGKQSGDAIALRYGNLFGPRNEQVIVMIDGGTKEAGQALVNHVITHYGTRKVDYVFCTHADGDHASGLTIVVEQLEVGVLIMQQPWDHAEEIRSLFKDGRITDLSLGIRIRKSLQAAHDLERTAIENGVTIVEAFAGDYTPDGAIRVLGPSRDYYQTLICNFRGTPEPKGLVELSLLKAAGVVDQTVQWFDERLFGESLREPSEDTSAENNSSMILYMEYEGMGMLFTGDAGVPALTHAADYAAATGIRLQGLRLLHVPHHGSKRNVGPRILNRITAETAYISASAWGEPKHPSKKVTNALKRRGASVFTTQGKSIRHHYNAPDRQGWSSATPVPFYDFVED